MDSFLIDYLNSGKAWVLVGSGPSIEMGYPSWEDLASFAAGAVKIEGPGHDLSILNAALKSRDFPKVFEEAKSILGGPRLLQVLQDKMTPSKHGEIYELIARWPVPVYLTTNYDDEIQKHLTNLGEAYIQYSNSEDHLKYLLPEFSGAIVKLHGDMRSEDGLILTTSQYRSIAEAREWEYWRTKMTSVFQMNRIVVIGHSLSDENIRHVLEAAKRGAGVLHPICWIAPDAPDVRSDRRMDRRREYLEEYRIRVIPYDNQDGQHANLVRLIENVSEFVPPRTSVRIKAQIAKVSVSPLGDGAGAPGFFVFNKLMAQANYETKRIEIIVAAIKSALPALTPLPQFSLETALELAGWPKGLRLHAPLSRQVTNQAIKQGILEQIGDGFRIGKYAQTRAGEDRKLFEHMQSRFKESLRIRVRRAYPVLTETDAADIASDIESSLTGFFREGGLSLATILFGRAKEGASPIPTSIIKFISEASASVVSHE